MIYHITSSREWEKAKIAGSYTTPTLIDEGFIHASLDHQVEGVLKRYYAGQSGLVKLEIDPARLSSQLVHEWSPATQDTFPHIYGAINIDAVVGEEEVGSEQ